MDTPTTSTDPETVANNEPLGSLAAADGSTLWAMLSNHPYYPSIEYFATEAEALVAAREEIKDMHREGAHHDDSTVSVARVTAHARIHTDY